MWKKTLMLTGALFLAGFIMLVIFIITLLGEIPDVRTIENLKIAQSTIIYDREGNELYNIHGEENRKYIPLSEIADSVKQATIAIEDKDFYRHGGVDLIGMLRSGIYIVLHPGEKLRSGSTITQQLAKNVFLTPEQTIRRKLKEIILSYELEQTYSKDKILELYLNQIPYGSNAYGIEMAAQTFFGKSAKDVTLAEAAILASLPKGPSYYSPYGQNKDALMGYCGQTQTASAEFTVNNDKNSSFTLAVRAKEKVWLRVNLDEGTTKEEMTLKAGDRKEFTADASIGLLLGNKGSVELSYMGFSFKPLASNSFVVTPQTIRDFLSDSEAFDKKIMENQHKEQQHQCHSMDDAHYVKGRKDFVLEAMQKEGYITEDQKQQTWLEAQDIQFKPYRENITYPHFVMYVKDYLEDKYGQEVVEKGGLKVTTTLDPKLQDLGQQIISDNIEKLEKQYKMSNMALISANPKTGQILAMIGSRDYWNDTYDGKVNVTTSYRQPGSSFKPFIYAAAFQQGYGAGTVLWDVKTQFGKGTPPNDADGQFLGNMTIRKALAWSRNIPAIKAYYLGGEEDKILDFLTPFGFGYLKTNRDEQRLKNPDYSYGWPMGIGSVEVRLLDMVQGYAIFANGGVKKELTPILEIKDREGNIIEKYNENSGKEAVLDPQIAYLINNILSDSAARPEGYWRDRITVPGQIVAAKTGTSNERVNKNLILPSDNWTMGYSTNLITGMWGGNSDGSPMTGSAFDINTIAALWKTYMAEALKDALPEEFPMPQGIVRLTVSSLSGKRVTQDTPEKFQVTDSFPSFGVPQEFDSAIKKVPVDTRNNLLASPDCPPVLVQEKYVLSPHEVLGREGWDAAIAEWIKNNSDKFPDVITEEPQETSPLCVPISEEQKPIISILAPLSYGVVTKGAVNVYVQTSAYFGVEKVEYYLDDLLQSTSTTSPYTGTVTIPTDTAVDAVHSIRAVVYDRNQYQSEATINVKITDQDTSPPHVQIIAPTEGEMIPLNTTVACQVSAYDDSSVIEQVEYYLDGVLLASVQKQPFTVSFFASSNTYVEGNHQLTVKAYDSAHNSNTATVSVDFIAPLQVPATFDIIRPTTGQELRVGITVPVQFVVKGKLIQEVTLMSKRSDGVYSSIQTINDIPRGSESFVISWMPDQIGSYDLYLKVLDTNGELSYSNRVAVTVQ